MSTKEEGWIGGVVVPLGRSRRRHGEERKGRGRRPGEGAGAGGEAGREEKTWARLASQVANGHSGRVPSRGAQDPAARVGGIHVYTFNELKETETWRRQLVDRLSN